MQVSVEKRRTEGQRVAGPNERTTYCWKLLHCSLEYDHLQHSFGCFILHHELVYIILSHASPTDITYASIVSCKQIPKDVNIRDIKRLKGSG